MLKMNRYLFAKRLGIILGKNNYCRMQSALKFVLSFARYYNIHCGGHSCVNRTVVFFVDGKTIHGGLSDRLRGLFSVYYYCLKRGYEFKVVWTYPFAIQDYFEPNKVNWLIDEKTLSHNLNEVAFRFFNSYSFMDNDEANYFKIMDSKKRFLHVYSNVTLHEELYNRFFNDLFKPSRKLNEALSECRKEIGGKYISVSFRFIGLLGDFKDTCDLYSELESNEEKELYIKKCLDIVVKLYNDNKNLCIDKVLVTSDSPTFLCRAMQLPFVYVTPGQMIHIDNVKQNFSKYDDAYLKSFLDMLMISNAEKCYSYGYGNMFKATKFARTAALIGGKDLITINE